jgi:hypothetical protein
VAAFFAVGVMPADPEEAAVVLVELNLVERFPAGMSGQDEAETHGLEDRRSELRGSVWSGGVVA